MLTGCSLCSPTMVVSHWRYSESNNHLIHKAACLSSPNLVLKTQSFLENYWPLVHIRNLKKPALLTVKEYSRNWTHGLASKCEGKQPRGKVSSFHILSPGLQLSMETPYLEWVSQLTLSGCTFIDTHTQRYVSILPWVFLNLITLIIRVGHRRRKPRVQTEAHVQQHEEWGFTTSVQRWESAERKPLGRDIKHGGSSAKSFQRDFPSKSAKDSHSKGKVGWRNTIMTGLSLT